MIETAVIILVLSLIITPLFGLYVQQERQEETRAEEVVNERVLTALAKHLKTNGAYPCPANPALGRTDLNFGVPDCAGAGIVLSGDVPVKALNLPLSAAANSAGWKYTYAVTNVLTDPVTFNNVGAITVQDAGGAPFLAQPAHFVVVNPGPDGKGARSLQGIASPNVCGAAALDSENCDGDDIFIEADFAMRSNVNNANYYDDSLSYALAREESTFWQTDEGPAGLNIAQRTPGNIGIGTADPQEKVHVFGGDVRVAGTSSSLLVSQDVLAEEQVEASNDIIVYTSTGRALAPIYYYAGTPAVPNCPSTGVTWMTNCAGTLPSTSSSLTETVNNTNPGYSGSATYTCDNGIWVWPPAGATCTGAAAYNTYSCSSGTWSLDSMNSCAAEDSYCTGSAAPDGSTSCCGSLPSGSCGTSFASCPSQTISWDGGNCSGTVAAGNHGDIDTVGNTQTFPCHGVPHVGAAGVTCDDGTWLLSSGGCACPSCASCAASVAGQCGPADGGTYSSPPSSGDLCDAGTASLVTDTGTSWEWTCSADTTVSCAATKPGVTCTMNWSDAPAQTLNVGDVVTAYCEEQYPSGPAYTCLYESMDDTGVTCVPDTRECQASGMMSGFSTHTMQSCP